MQIIFDHQIFSIQRYGGISRYFFELSRSLADMGSDLATVCINSPLYVNNYLRHAKAPLKVTGFQGPRFRGGERLCQAVSAALSPVFMRSFGPDIVHETYYSRHSLAPCKSRVVITVYDMIHELFPQYFSAVDQTVSIKKTAILRADHVICISEHTRQDLIRLLGVPSEKTSVVHLGFSLSTTAVAQIGRAKKPYLLFVGTRGGYKNFNRLLEAYASTSCVKSDFDLLAFGGGAFNQDERNLINNLGLRPEQVKQLGGGDDVLAACYKNAALFVYPSLYEGFGIPPLEAMSYGCPVVCSNLSSIPEVVGGAARMFDPNSTEDMAAAISDVLQHSEEQRKLKELGSQRINQFSWQRCALETYSVYQKVLS